MAQASGEVVKHSSSKNTSVRGLVIILLTQSALTLAIAYFNVEIIAQAPERYVWWALPVYYFLATIGVVSSCAAVMLPTYTRVGLILGTASVVFYVIVTASLFILGRGTNPLSLALSIMILCVFFIFLRTRLKNEPEKHI